MSSFDISSILHMFSDGFFSILNSLKLIRVGPIDLLSFMIIALIVDLVITAFFVTFNLGFGGSREGSNSSNRTGDHK